VYATGMGDEGGEGRVVVLVGSEEIRACDRGSLLPISRIGTSADSASNYEQTSIRCSRLLYHLRSLRTVQRERLQPLPISPFTSALVHPSNPASSISTHPHDY